MEKKSLLEQRRMTLEELKRYKAELRHWDNMTCQYLKGVTLRKRLYPLIKLILEIDRITSHERLIKVGDKHTKSKKGHNGIIYAATHIGGKDIERTLQIINESAWLLLGNPGVLYRMLEYKGLLLNGVIPFETLDKRDRSVAYERSKELLTCGGNLLIYPEAAWNLTPNLPVMKTFPGAVKLAVETGSEIVPVALERYGNDFYYNIGENIKYERGGSYNLDNLNKDLRDTLCTLKWEIYELQEQIKRGELPPNALEEYQNEILYRNNYGEGFTMDDFEIERYHDKTITTPEEAFAFRKLLK